MRAKVKAVCKNMGSSVSASGVVSLRLRASYSELPNTVHMLVMLSQSISVKARLPSSKPFCLGWWMLGEIRFAGDGESDIKLRGTVDNVEMDKVNSLPLAHDDSPEFQVMLECDIEELEGDVDKEAGGSKQSKLKKLKAGMESRSGRSGEHE